MGALGVDDLNDVDRYLPVPRATDSELLVDDLDGSGVFGLLDFLQSLGARSDQEEDAHDDDSEYKADDERCSEGDPSTIRI